MDDGPASSSYKRIINARLLERVWARSLRITALDLSRD